MSLKIWSRYSPLISCKIIKISITAQVEKWEKKCDQAFSVNWNHMIGPKQVYISSMGQSTWAYSFLPPLHLSYSTVESEGFNLRKISLAMTCLQMYILHRSLCHDETCFFFKKRKKKKKKSHDLIVSQINLI